MSGIKWKNKIRLLLPFLLLFLGSSSFIHTYGQQWLTKAIQKEQNKGLDEYDLDYGLKAGGANYLGDIGGEMNTRRDFILDLKPVHTSFALGGFLRYEVYPTVFIQFGGVYGRIRGADSNSTNPARVGRNLNFRNDIKELYLRAEYVFYTYYGVGIPERYQLNLRTYIFAGGSFFHHYPKAYYKGEWIPLRTLRTEGKNEPYPQFQVSIPAGFGIHFTYDKEYRFGLEVGWRTTFTDYLDDISTEYASPQELDTEMARELSNRTDELDNRNGLPHKRYYEPGQKRGDPTHDDSYLFVTLTFSKVIKWKNLKKKIKKKVFGKGDQGRIRQPLEDIER